MRKQLLSLALIGLCATGYAKDLGTYGNTFKISEEDFLTYIMAKMAHFQSSQGGEKAFEAKVKAKVRKESMNPVQPIHYGITSSGNVYRVDPSITLKKDIVTPDGHVLGHKGEVINPFKRMPMRYQKDLIFIDGTDARQVAWAKIAVSALKEHHKPYYMILVKGNLKKAYDKLGTIKFDYFGMLSKKTGIKTVPSIVMQQGDQWQVQQIACKINYCTGGRV